MLLLLLLLLLLLGYIILVTTFIIIRVILSLYQILLLLLFGYIILLTIFTIRCILVFRRSIFFKYCLLSVYEIVKTSIVVYLLKSKHCRKFGPNDPVDPVLQKEMNLMKDLLANSATAEVPFTPYLTKAQKKKAVNVAYLTLSQGPPCHLPNDCLF